jgi:ankyrin repeat protein
MPRESLPVSDVKIAVDAYGNSELHYAVAERDEIRVRDLLRNGANINQANFFDETPMMLAESMFREYHPIYKILSEYQDKLVSELFSAIEIDNDEKILELIKSGLSPDSPAPSSYFVCFTALTFAARIGSILSMKTLIECGADINHKDKNGLSPIHYAILRKSYDEFEFCLENGADLTVIDWEGRGLEVYIDKPETELIKYLESQKTRLADSPDTQILVDEDIGLAGIVDPARDDHEFIMKLFEYYRY